VTAIPLLIMGDAPTAQTGLGRICRDLASRIAADMQGTFRVATYGGAHGAGSRALPFQQYAMSEAEDLGPRKLPEVWRDFAGEEKGIVLTIMDASRLLWFSEPRYCKDQRLRKFLEERRFLKWAYLPIDAAGPNDKLSYAIRLALEGFDRLLAYSAWAKGVVERTVGVPSTDCPGIVKCDWLPHGIDTSTFKPRDKKQARARFPGKVGDGELLVGIVATNQRRKDWGLGIQAVAELARVRKVRLWINTDALVREWDIEALLYDFGLVDRSVASFGGLEDEEMAWRYSACDVTLAIGLGEGFGYSAAESLACGVPVVAPDYGGGEFVPSDMLIKPCAYRHEGIFGAIRPVMLPQDYVSRALEVIGESASLPSNLDWDNLWPRWKSWLAEGVK
jgi:glycosyltransferase involved in cell wall biosynthesis